METVRLTSVENLDKLLIELQKDPAWVPSVNYNFMHDVLPEIRAELKRGEDKLYLEIHTYFDTFIAQHVIQLRCVNRSKMLTDIEYLKLRKFNQKVDKLL